jgi:chromosome segregation ATPase
MKRMSRLVWAVTVAALLVVPAAAGQGAADDDALAKFQRELAVELEKTQTLLKIAEQCQAIAKADRDGKAKLEGIEVQNRQLSSDLAVLHQRAEDAERRAAKAESERDRARAELGNLREKVAEVADTSRKSLVQIVNGVTTLHEIGVADGGVGGMATPALKPR